MSDKYTLKELIDKLDEIRINGDGALSVPKALMALTKEILDLRLQIYKLNHKLNCETKLKGDNEKD
ncbi:MAG TPA: hypothetical protein VGK47_11405 [Nitrososphaeraceae archaeon]